MKDDEIKVRIAEVAKEEFLELGYVDASMRNISAKAGLTTGSLYNRFRDKAELFEYIVGDGVRAVYDKFQAFNSAYDVAENASEDDSYQHSAMKFILDTMFEHYDAFDLVINKGVGSPYENYVEKLVAIATENTKNYVFANKPGMKDPSVAEDITHLLNVALFDAIAEIFRKHYSKESADYYLQNIFKFYNAGWDAILKK